MQLSIQIASMEGAFDVLNERLFGGELPRPVITVYQKPGTNGHFTPWKSWADSGSGERREEINLAADAMDRPVIDIMATLVHEMCHLYCHVHGIADTSREGRYHNKRFAEVGRAHGLRITQDRVYGWTVTRPGPALIELDEEGCFDGVRNDLARLSGFCASRTGGPAAASGGAPRKRKYLRYSCPCCGATVRSSKPVRVSCDDCRCQMEPEP